MDYAQARYYANGQGRFTAVDPLLASASPANPQTWNRYSYTINNPLRYTDPTGLYLNSTSVSGSGTVETQADDLTRQLKNIDQSIEDDRAEAERMARAEELSNQFWEENGMAPLGAGLAAFQELNSSLVERQNGNLTDQATDAGLADLIATRSNNPYNFIRHGHLNCVALAYLRTSVRSAATFHLSGN